MKSLLIARRLLPASRAILPSLSAGLVIGALEIFTEASYGALVFSGTLDSFVAQGIGLMLFGTMVIAAVVAIGSSFPSSIGVPQDASVAIIAAVAAAIATSMPAASPERIFATVVVAMMLSAILTGLSFWLLGHFSLGRLVRFVPVPVIGGFLAGTGWLLIVGAMGVMVNAPFGLALVQADALARWLPGLLFAATLLMLIRRYSHPLLMPAVLVAGIGLFYGIYFLSNGTISSAGTKGWLLGPLPEGGLWQPLVGLSVIQADWGIVLSHGVSLSSIVLISVITLLLNASCMEITARQDMDLNRELKSAGVANITAGLGGSPAGYHAISLTALGHRLGGRSRLVGLTTAAMAAIALFFGSAILSFFPRPIAGGFLLFLGLAFLVEWLYDAWFKLPKLDYLLIWLILIVIAVVGFLEGVAAGIIVAVLLFVLNYSRTKSIRHAFTGAHYQSSVMRPRLYQQLLEHRGDRLHIMELQGFIFFGTAYRLVEQIRSRLDDPTLPQLHFLLLDFRLVTGIDSSAALSFSKLRQVVQAHDTELVLTGLSDEMQSQWTDNAFGYSDDEDPYFFSDLDQGVAWCEEQMIDIFASVGLVARPKALLDHLDDVLLEADDKVDWLDLLHPLAERPESPRESKLMAYLERVQVVAGQRLISEGDRVKGLYFVETGQYVAQIRGDDGRVATLRTMQAGTAFGEIDFYSGQKATATVTASQSGLLFYLSEDSLHRMETEDPRLAVAFHRFIASTMGNKLLQMGQTVRALQS